MPPGLRETYFDRSVVPLFAAFVGCQRGDPWFEDCSLLAGFLPHNLALPSLNQLLVLYFSVALSNGGLVLYTYKLNL